VGAVLKQVIFFLNIMHKVKTQTSEELFVKNMLIIYFYMVIISGIAGPLAAWCGGQIWRPFVLGFANWRAYSTSLM